MPLKTVTYFYFKIDESFFWSFDYIMYLSGKLQGERNWDNPL